METPRCSFVRAVALEYCFLSQVYSNAIATPLLKIVLRAQESLRLGDPGTQ